LFLPTKNSFLGVPAFDASLVAIKASTPDSSIEMHPYASPYSKSRMEYGSMEFGYPRMPFHRVDMERQELRKRTSTHRGGTEA
jgi:hypothetical protein